VHSVNDERPNQLASLAGKSLESRVAKLLHFEDDNPAPSRGTGLASMLFRFVFRHPLREILREHLRGDGAAEDGGSLRSTVHSLLLQEGDVDRRRVPRTL
jgi:hypothetical protein